MKQKHTKRTVDQLAIESNKVIFIDGDKQGIPYHAYKFPLTNGEMYCQYMPLPVFALNKWNEKLKKMGSRLHLQKVDYERFGELGEKVYQLERKFQSVKDSYERIYLRQGVRTFYQVVPSTNTDNEMYFTYFNKELDTFPSVFQYILSLPKDQRPIDLTELAVMRRKLWVEVLNYFLEDSNDVFEKANEATQEVIDKLNTIKEYNSKVKVWNKVKIATHPGLGENNIFFLFRLAYEEGNFKDNFSLEDRKKLEDLYSQWNDVVGLISNPSLMVEISQLIAKMLGDENLASKVNAIIETYPSFTLFTEAQKISRANSIFDRFRQCYDYYKKYLQVNNLNILRKRYLIKNPQLFIDMIDFSKNLANETAKSIQSSLYKLGKLFDQKKLEKLQINDQFVLPELRMIDENCDLMKSYISFELKYEGFKSLKKRIEKLKEENTSLELTLSIPDFEFKNHSYSFSVRNFQTLNWQKQCNADYIKSQIWVRDLSAYMKNHGELIYA